MENENIVAEDTIEETFDNEESTEVTGIPTAVKVIGGAAAVALGAAGTYAVTHKDKVAGFFRAKKINRLEKKVLKDQAKLEKLYDEDSNEEKTE